MKAQESRLQLHQVEISPQTILKKDLVVYLWPEKLVEILKKEGHPYALDVAIKNLSDFIMQGMDQVLCAQHTFNRNTSSETDRFWLFCESEIDQSILDMMIQSWLIKSKITKITVDDLAFDWPIILKTEMLFDIFKEKENFLYSLIPKLYLRAMCEQSFLLPSLGHRLDFFQVIANDSQEIISNTISCPSDKEIERYSYGLRIKLVKTREFWPSFSLNIHASIKVWRQKPMRYFDFKKGQSVYIAKENNYLINSKRRFVKLMITYDRDQAYKYKNETTKILASLIDLKLDASFANPSQYNHLSKEDDHKDVVLYTNADPFYVKKGVGLNTRIDFYNEFTKRFPELKPRPALLHVGKRAYPAPAKKKKLKDIKESKHLMSKRTLDLLQRGHFFYANPPVNKLLSETLYIEIYTDNDELENAFIDVIIGILRLQMPINRNHYQSSDGYALIFVRKDAWLARGLSQKEQNSRRRMDEIKKLLLSSDDYGDNPVLSFIEIEPFHLHKKWQNRKEDPKKQIRWAFKDCGRVTQFINNYASNQNKHALVNASYDLLTAAGFISHDYFSLNLNPKILLGLSGTPNSNGNFIVLSKIEEGKTSFKVCGLSDENWLPFHAIIPKIKENTVNELKSKIKKNGFLNQWISDQLKTLSPRKDVLFYFDAALSRKGWKFARNDGLNPETLRILDKDRFSFIRVNTTSELPSYHIFKNKDDHEGLNRNQGLFTNDGSIFYNIGEKPASSKVDKRATKASRPTTLITKAKIVELVILSDGQNTHLAHLTSDLRKSTLSFDSSTLYPLPIHINGRFKEYLTSYK